MTYFGSTADAQSTAAVVALIEKSIDPFNPNSNLELYFEICDLINLKEENAKEAFKTIKRELNVYKGKNWSIVLKILMLTEVCSNNCSKKFQIHLAHKEFLSDLKLMLSPKLQPPIEIQEKILYLIQYWSNTFKNDSDFKPIEALYSELRSKGVDFPVNNPDLTSFANQLNANNKNGPAAAAAAAAVTAAVAVTRASNETVASQPNKYQRLPNDAQPAIGVVKLNEDQIAKLNSELDIVENNVHILNEILNELQSGGAKANSNPDADKKSEDLTLLQDLYKTCKEMQRRITQLIGSISNENVINELLRINDDLNNGFLRYERFDRSVNIHKSKPSPDKTGEPAAAAANATTAAAAIIKKSDDKSLIDFDDFDPRALRQSAENSRKPAPNDQEKATANVVDKITPVGPNHQATAAADKNMIDDEASIKEMEDWLKLQGLNDDFPNGENVNSTK